MTRLDDALAKSPNGVIYGQAVQNYDPTFVELAAHLGFSSIWIEMEHMMITFQQAMDLCRITQGLGMLAMIRIPDTRRENVLKAAECGPDIIDVPMANSPEVIEELVYHARYAPKGSRGFFGSSRAVNYSLHAPTAEEQKRVNRELCLMAQVETKEAVERVNELCAVPGLDAVFIGPGDLSASLGLAGETMHPKVQEAIECTISAAKSAGKRVAIACGPADAKHWAEKSAELIYCGSNVLCERLGLEAIQEHLR